MHTPVAVLDAKLLYEQVDKTMRRDQYRLRRDLNSLLRKSPSGMTGKEKADTKQLAKLQTQLQARIDASQQELQWRQNNIPQLNFPADLPITARRLDIAELITAHQVVILAGQTGSGKTTQIPKICLQLGRGQQGLIGHTQPRRLAARTVAVRIAEELHQPLGQAVGYQVRFERQLSSHSSQKNRGKTGDQPNNKPVSAEVDSDINHNYIKIMTDGILLAEIQHDRFLEKYDTIIIDEAHERSLNIDFLLGYLKQLLPRRPDLKLIITSATIDLDIFSRHFDNAPVIEVSGRTYPVETRYQTPAEQGYEGQSQEILTAIEYILQLERQMDQASGPGDILVFLSGERDIREAALAIRKAQLPRVEVLPLYARLSSGEQRKVFDTLKRHNRRVVLATNVAETSLTVPGIRYVIDTGLARISRYNFRTKVQRLPIEPISQASANQRKGRCGRVSDGLCIRLYSEEDFENRPAFTDPELRRTNLASVILQMLTMKIGDISQFPFIEPPDNKMINDGFKLLEELGAVDRAHQLSAAGRQMGRLPVDPRIARMLLAAAGEGSLKELLIIGSALSVADPRERPSDKKAAADEAHKRFEHESSDFVSLIKLWDHYEEQRQALSQNQLRKLCKREFLSFMRMREWREIHYQLRLAAKDLGLKENQQKADYRCVHRAILAGLLSLLGVKHENREYLGARNRKFKVFPGSVLAKKNPQWLVAGEIVETSAVFARNVAKIEPDWLFGLADHLFKRSYSEPHWHQRRGQVVALEKVCLYGLQISDNRRINYGVIKPDEAHAIFIQGALVAGHFKTSAAFFHHNNVILAELEALEAKSRRRDILVDSQLLYDFYVERIPDSICTAVAFSRWLKKGGKRRSELLMINRQHLLKRDVGDVNEVQYPNCLHWQDLQIPLEYRFEPGHEEDGITAIIPIGVINRLPLHLFEWLVPGVLRDKSIALMKTLPKQYRKHFVPIPDFVDKVLVQLQAKDEPLLECLATQLTSISGVQLTTDLFRNFDIDAFYKMHFKVVVGDGSILGMGRDLVDLLKQFKNYAQESLCEQVDHQYQQSGLTEWNFAELPLVYEFQQAGVTVKSFPTLVDQGDSVAIELRDYAHERDIDHCAGVVKLIMLAMKKQTTYLRRELLKSNQLQLQFGALANRSQMIEDLVPAIFKTTFLGGPDRGGSCLDGTALPRNQVQFQELVASHRQNLMKVALRYDALIEEIFNLYFAIHQKLKSDLPGDWRISCDDIQCQLTGLVYSGFLSATPFASLKEYPRYLRAIELRLQKMGEQLQKDKNKSLELRKYAMLINEKLKSDTKALVKDQELLNFRWLTEEYRVSLFAQSLGTKIPVSAKRLDRQWAKVLK